MSNTCNLDTICDPQKSGLRTLSLLKLIKRATAPSIILIFTSSCGITTLSPLLAPESNVDGPLDPESVAPQKISSETNNINIMNEGSNALSAKEAIQLEPKLDVITAPIEDLWERIRQGSQLDVTNAPKIVDEKRDWYLENPSYLKTVFQRAEPFIFYVVNELEKANMPLELALLPIVESTYDPLAYSPSHAAGLWQFIPSTGRHYGLDRNRWYDGRRDIIRSTGAAIEYLSYLNRRFDGDWLIALAAYNAGEGYVDKAIRKNKKRGKPTDFWHLSLPRETRNYVPKLLALTTVVNNPQKFAIELPAISNESYFESIEINNQIALSLVLDISGTDRNLFTQLNAAYRRSITPPEGTYQLVLPTKNAAKFRHFSETSDPKTWVPHTEYMVSSGDTLSHIAVRFDSPVKSIKKRNGMLSDRLQIGQILLVPHSEGDVVTMSQIPRYDNVTHVIELGDSLSSLALKYKTTTKDIRKQNGLASDTIIIGQSLEIRSLSKSSMSAEIRKLSYRVKKGDSLALIAKRFSLKVSDITRWNKISSKQYIQPGQRLTLLINPRLI